MKLWKKIVYSFLALLLVVNILIWTTGTTYIYKALIYQQVGINDLDLFDYRIVKSSDDKQPWKIAENYNKARLTDSLRKILEDYQSAAFLVIQNDSIRYEEYWDGYSDSSLSNSFSMAKSVISMLVGIAINEGKMKSVDQPVSDFLEEFKEGEKAKITLRHLLTMSSGLDFMESYSSPINYTTEAYYGNDLRKLVTKLKVIEEPGTICRYKSGDTQVLSLALSNATGKSVSDYFAEKIWSRIGTLHDARWNIDHKNGDEKAYCCIYSNARDFARLGKLYLNNGVWEGQQLVPEDWVRQSITPNRLPGKEFAAGKDDQPVDIYGWQWWLMNRHDYSIFYMRGLAGQYVVCIPEKKMIIVRLGHKRSNKKVDGHPVDVITFVDEAIKIYP